MTRVRVVLVYLTADLVPRAVTRCAARGWQVVYTVPTDRYAEAIDLAYAERLIVVAASPGSLDPDRVPRVEVLPDEM
jgi:hypothetical protein